MAYQVINSIFERMDADMCAAEAHGMAAGMLCLNAQADSASWLNELFPNAAPLLDEDKTLLLRLFEQTGDLLASDEFEFDLLLPEDEALLGERIEALSRWCQGFLFGVGSSYSESVWPGDVGEILKDIMEFTKLDAEAEGEEDESAFMEITEYLRSAALLLRDELGSNTAGTIH
jgi:uncharacterized protein YgfB (UPF0149 family)